MSAELPINAKQFFKQSPAIALVRVEAARGSCPREAGAWMLVSPTGIYKTIGGGRLEHKAIEAARALLIEGGAAQMLDIPLGPEIGQCCGGHVTLSISHLESGDQADIIAREASEYTDMPAVYVFGAGHVGRALMTALLPLPVRPLLIDNREEELELAPPQAEKQLTPLPETCVRNAASGSAFVIATHEHHLDFMITHEALARGDAKYVGMIGSKTKRAQFMRWQKKLDAQSVDVGSLVCPIGALGSKDKRPEIIAAFTAAEIMLRLTA